MTIVTACVGDRWAYFFASVQESPMHGSTPWCSVFDAHRHDTRGLAKHGAMATDIRVTAVDRCDSIAQAQFADPHAF